MKAQHLILGGGVVALLYFLFKPAQALASNGGGLSSGASGGASNPSGTAMSMTGNAPASTTVNRDPYIEGQYAEFARIRDAAITPTSTVKNHYDWIQAIWLNVGGYINNSLKGVTPGYATTYMNEMKAWLDTYHSQAYPSVAQKTLQTLGGVYNFVGKMT